MSDPVAWCNRCRTPAPVDPDELAGDGGGDPALLPLVVPPVGWIPDPEDADGAILCGECATDVEIVDFMKVDAMLERLRADASAGDA